MLNINNNLKLLFVINHCSGTSNQNLNNAIISFFEHSTHNIELFEIPKKCSVDRLNLIISKAKPNRVIAVGGDGTLKLVAECLAGTTIPIGIIPAGSANGMAKELNIPLQINDALALITEGIEKEIHAISINNELCIHLSDIGFNAYLVKRFDQLPTRGMWTYAKAAWYAFWNHRKVEVEFKIEDRVINTRAAMVVIANGKQYGTGLEINPDGKLEDDLFEVILIKEYDVMEILKIWFSKLPWNPQKIERFQTNEVTITTKRKAHFQIDGEYKGKTTHITAKLLPAAIKIITPRQ